MGLKGGLPGVQTTLVLESFQVQILTMTFVFDVNAICHFLGFVVHY